MSIIIPFMLLITNVLLFFPQFPQATDTITQFQSLIDGRTLVSKDGSFEFGFFTPGSSNNRYVGIWYKNIPPRTVVWVANRENASKDNSSMLNINKEGNLVLLNQNKSVICSTNTKTKALNPILQLLSSGNLVLREEQDQNPKNYLWQSFDYPSDTFLPGMKLGLDFKTGLNRRLSAWKNWDDPSPGDFTKGFILTNNPELVMWKNSTEYYRSGPWNGLLFSYRSSLIDHPTFKAEFVRNQDELYFSYSLKEKIISRVVMNQTMLLQQRYIWIEEAQNWRVSSFIPRDICDDYNICGPFGICDKSQRQFCQCLRGFEPKSPERWNATDWTEGCVRSRNWSCREKNKDGFSKFSNLKVPDTKGSWVNGSMTLDECKAKCFGNCGCTAYANTDIRRNGSGCAIWFDDLIDMRHIPDGGQDLYVRVAASEIENQSGEGGKRKVAILVAIIASMILRIILIFACIYKMKRKCREKNDGKEQEELELPFFDFATISHATNRFSSDNKLGQGGFGPVYRGTLADGQQIAVKRLSQKSGQGLKEFRNEVILCAKLQHRNLVKVLGCCVEGEEKLLIYEYMPNKSLDFFLFDSTQRKLLNWPIRFHIICGITRGLLYLHQDSRLRIIHRDLKANNILLDSELNPKISDFGLARMFRGDEIEGNTSKVVGTFGYMAPEYAINGSFSIKSDIFSFGILLLEIISGKKNRGFSYQTHSLNLLGHAWKLWKKGVPWELMDDCLTDSCNASKILRCMHVGLLCVQQHPDDRPNMASVVAMLSSENALPQPKEPGFLMEKTTVEGNSSLSKQISSSINGITMTLL